MLNVQNKNRCKWVGENPLMIKYHDTEWGVPTHNDKKLFEFFVLDTFQAGLSWEITLNKRDGFHKAFEGFDVKKVATFTKKDVANLLKDVNIIRNRLKIEATINNAKRFLEIKKEFGSFDKYIWQFTSLEAGARCGPSRPLTGFTNYRTIKNKYAHDSQLRSISKESKLMSDDLKKRGFKFVGSTIIYAFMQGAGMINDHIISCFRYKQV